MTKGKKNLKWPLNPDLEVCSVKKNILENYLVATQEVSEFLQPASCNNHTFWLFRNAKIPRQGNLLKSWWYWFLSSTTKLVDEAIELPLFTHKRNFGQLSSFDRSLNLKLDNCFSKSQKGTKFNFSLWLNHPITLCFLAIAAKAWEAKNHSLYWSFYGYGYSSELFPGHAFSD